MSGPLVINEQLTIPASDFRWTAVRASGPGGQNVNKVASKVELRFDLDGTSALDEACKARLRLLAGVRLDGDGAVFVTSQKTRDQAKNLEDAREKVREVVLRALFRPTPRRATKPSRARVRARLDDKRKQSEKKNGRRSAAE